MNPPRRWTAFLGTVALAWMAASCEPATETDVPDEPSLEGAALVVQEAIGRHGGELFDRSRITFTFRGTVFELRRDGGLFHYERRYTDEQGRRVAEILDNEGTRMEVDGEEVTLDPDGIDRL